jgi:hypothetical protein
LAFQEAVLFFLCRQPYSAEFALAYFQNEAEQAGFVCLNPY